MDMKNVMGILNLNENCEQLMDLTYNRPVAAIPFCGRYRLIDFAMSNMVNAGIWNIGIMLHQNNFSSLIDHIRSGKEWDLDRKTDGLFILPPKHDHVHEGASKRDLESFYDNIDYIERSRQKFVVVSPTNMIANVDLKAAFRFHQEKGADITVIYKGQDPEYYDFNKSTILQMDSDGRVTDMEMHPKKIHFSNMSMEMYIMDKNILLELVDSCVSRGLFDMVKDGFIRNLDRYRVYGYEHKGYLARIHSTHSYFSKSLELLDPAVWKDLFFRNGLVQTKSKDEPPTKYNQTANVTNSLIANGCIVSGNVENSIIFRGVHIKKGATVKNCIVMQNTIIGEGAYVENVIFDKECSLKPNKRFYGDPEYPLVVKKGVNV